MKKTNSLTEDVDHVVLQGGADRITSIAVPLAFVGVGTFMLGGGLLNLYRGVGKEDQ